ncbi:MAG TPA: MgtC/SapB family protein [Anaeromyxobacteraceae bacterium]|nr:MgtC/SapB family protein [Anaeromyxobacteraceae bacterium]
MITHWEMLLRITVAAFLGGIIGGERDIHRRQAGFRTHLIVSMASATFMVVSSQFVYFQHYAAGSLVSVDTSRIAASVVAGVGFLGGGSILRTGTTVQGLTTAAGLWLVAAVGLAAGSGMYPESVYVTLLGLLALTVLRFLEDKKVMRRRVVLAFGNKGDPFTLITAALSGLGAKVLDLDYQKDLGADRTSVTFDILIPNSLGIPQLVRALGQLDGRMLEVQVRTP